MIKNEAGINVEIPGGFKLEAFATESSQVVDETKKYVNISSRAQSDGHQNYPPSDAVELSATEQKIVDYCQDRLDSIAQKASYALNYLKNKLEKHLQEIKIPDYQIIERQIDVKTQDIRSDSQTQLTDLRKDERLSLRDLKRFYAKNHLDRPAEYPESRILTASLLFTRYP